MHDTLVGRLCVKKTGAVEVRSGYAGAVAMRVPAITSLEVSGNHYKPSMLTNEVETTRLSGAGAVLSQVEG
jgi:hypothetical protein